MIFYQVIRRGRRGGRQRIVHEGNHRGRAEAAFAREKEKMRDGHLYLEVDGQVEAWAYGGYNRTRW